MQVDAPDAFPCSNCGVMLNWHFVEWCDTIQGWPLRQGDLSLQLVAPEASAEP
jgi:hypothetical protein